MSPHSNFVFKLITLTAVETISYFAVKIRSLWSSNPILTLKFEGIPFYSESFHSDSEVKELFSMQTAWSWLQLFCHNTQRDWRHMIIETLHFNSRHGVVFLLLWVLFMTCCCQSSQSLLFKDCYDIPWTKNVPNFSIISYFLMDLKMSVPLTGMDAVEKL